MDNTRKVIDKYTHTAGSGQFLFRFVRSNNTEGTKRKKFRSWKEAGRWADQYESDKDVQILSIEIG